VDDDEVAGEPIEDFGLDDIKVPKVDLRAKGFPRRPATTEAADVVDEVGLPVDTDESEADEGDAAAGGIATAELTTDEAAAAGEIATAGPTIGAAGAEGEIAPTGLTIDEAAADATGGQARAAAVGDDEIAAATTGEARVAEASAPRAPFDDDGIDDAGIVDLDELDDEDKSPPDEGRS
jgi:hypothetical protein